MSAPNAFARREVWFLTGSQHLYGPEALGRVAEHSSALARAFSPPIHIFAGENVCIQTITPTHDSAAFASTATRRIEVEFVATSRYTTPTGMSACPSRPAATSRACASTCRSVACPYSS